MNHVEPVPGATSESSPLGIPSLPARLSPLGISSPPLGVPSLAAQSLPPTGDSLAGRSVTLGHAGCSIRSSPERGADYSSARRTHPVDV
jgi:hypothetical protein